MSESVQQMLKIVAIKDTDRLGHVNPQPLGSGMTSALPASGPPTGGAASKSC
jgi:hypothetical protein